ncbi:hypothetical protein FACS189431_7800 [Alphaproteobacteria bacterium]|nr:hypothetical protein FACS189431_7800 [Alphaproteobacteria bacterium]
MEYYTSMNNQDEQHSVLSDNIRGIAKELQTIYSQAEIYYTSAVNDIIRHQSKDTKEIEHLLNYMLDFADNEKILMLYRMLCRYYLDINPQATAEYIQSYKELYDTDEKLFESGYFRDNPIKF